MAACLKLGSKVDGFQRRGQAWFCTTGLPSDVVIEVEEMSFHLHKFPLMAKSGRLARQITEEEAEDGGCVIQLPDIPGGTEAFELAAKFCYGVKLELTANSVVILRCAAEYLEMTEEFGEGNLIVKTEGFLNQVVLRSWKDSIRALQACERVLTHAEELGIVKRCVDSISTKACSDPSLFGWPLMDHHLTMQSPGGSVLWNGISTGARPRHTRSDWWYEDTSALSLPIFQRLITAMESRGLKAEIIAGALTSYAKRYLPGLNRRQGVRSNEGGSGSKMSSTMTMPAMSMMTSMASEMDQRMLLETIEGLLPMQKSVTPTRFLFGLLRIAMILNASAETKRSLEMRIGVQLEQASLDDLLMPNYSYTVETLYDIDAVQRIVSHFLATSSPSEHQHEGSLLQSFEEGGGIGGASPSMTSPMAAVAKLMDCYLAEVAPDVNLKLAKFMALAESLPEYARLLDDGLYRAVDIYLKAHPWLTEHEREKLCRTMDCQKLSLEACTHAAQNERLPLRVVVQVLFFEQLQLRTAIAGCFLVADNVEPPPPPPASSRAANVMRMQQQQQQQHQQQASDGRGWVNVIRENETMKDDMEKMRKRVMELEKECCEMRREIEKIGKFGSHHHQQHHQHQQQQQQQQHHHKSSSSFSLAKKLGCRMRPQVCNSHESSSVIEQMAGGVEEDSSSVKKTKHRRSHSLV